MSQHPVCPISIDGQRSVELSTRLLQTMDTRRLMMMGEPLELVRHGVEVVDYNTPKPSWAPSQVDWVCESQVAERKAKSQKIEGQIRGLSVEIV